MSYILAWDTETSDLPLWREPSDHPSQPFIVSIAMLKLDPETLDEIDTFYSIIKPPAGRTIPAETAKIHGITTERAMAEGRDAAPIVRLYAQKRRECRASLAHNASFDVRMMRIEMLRQGATKEECDAIEASSPQLCTMRMATPLLNMPPTVKMKKAGFGDKPKNASLSDCARYLFDVEHEGAHGALEDARMCARVYRRLLEMEANASRAASVVA